MVGCDEAAPIGVLRPLLVHGHESWTLGRWPWPGLCGTVARIAEQEPASVGRFLLRNRAPREHDKVSASSVSIVWGLDRQNPSSVLWCLARVDVRSESSVTIVGAFALPSEHRIGERERRIPAATLQAPDRKHLPAFSRSVTVGVLKRPWPDGILAGCRSLELEGKVVIAALGNRPRTAGEAGAVLNRRDVKRIRKSGGGALPLDERAGSCFATGMGTDTANHCRQPAGKGRIPRMR